MATARARLGVRLWSTVALVLVWPHTASAFGPSGHRVAGHVAERYLCPETRAALAPLLGDLTLADAGLWPDAIRSQPEWEHTRPWHYINVPDRGSVARAARRDGDNVLAALDRYERQLRNPALDTRQRGLALRFVVHFAVDIHQPLHVGRLDDRGGNLVPVQVAGRETNLHALWDGEPLRLAVDQGPRARARALGAPVAGLVRRWQAGSPVDWARESQRLRRQVYAFDPRSAPAELPEGYVERARATVDQRLLQAGIRLAGRLDVLLGPGRVCGAEVASARSNL